MEYSGASHVTVHGFWGSEMFEIKNSKIPPVHRGAGEGDPLSCRPSGMSVYGLVHLLTINMTLFFTIFVVPLRLVHSNQ
jgi:hypothetical protein